MLIRAAVIVGVIAALSPSPDGGATRLDMTRLDRLALESLARDAMATAGEQVGKAVVQGMMGKDRDQLALKMLDAVSGPDPKTTSARPAVPPRG